MVYEITRLAYLQIVIDPNVWLHCGDVNGSHTCYELSGLRDGDYALVECVVEFGRVGNPVVVNRFATADEAMRAFARWNGDALKLAQFYGATTVRYFEVWHIVDRHEDIFESYVALEIVHVDCHNWQVVGQTKFETHAQLNRFLHQHDFQACFTDIDVSVYRVFYFCDSVIYSVFPEAAAWDLRERWLLGVGAGC